MKLEIVSAMRESLGRTLRPYRVDAIDTVGVHDGEPYSIVFRNDSFDSVQVILSVDGRNVLTGRDAVLDPSQDNFIVRGNRSMTLEAWPETSERGSRFVFTNAGNSVAVHTPGELGSLGYISAAVYVEDDPLPVFRGGAMRGGPTFGAERGLESATRGMTSKSAVGTGMGEEISQRISTTTGLRRPRYSGVLQVRYLWWDELVARLREQGIQTMPSHPTGFVERPLANLGTAPRLGATVASRDEYSRFTA